MLVQSAGCAEGKLAVGWLELGHLMAPGLSCVPACHANPKAILSPRAGSEATSTWGGCTGFACMQMRRPSHVVRRLGAAAVLLSSLQHAAACVHPTSHGGLLLLSWLEVAGHGRGCKEEQPQRRLL